MIYYMEYRQSKPKRVRSDHALDYYQMWFGNERGQEMFNDGQLVTMPQDSRIVLRGEEISESVWFKQILQGHAEDGFVQLDGTIKTFAESWH